MAVLHPQPSLLQRAAAQGVQQLARDTEGQRWQHCLDSAGRVDHKRRGSIVQERFQQPRRSLSAAGEVPCVRNLLLSAPNLLDERRGGLLLLLVEFQTDVRKGRRRVLSHHPLWLVAVNGMRGQIAHGALFKRREHLGGGSCRRRHVAADAVPEQGARVLDKVLDQRQAFDQHRGFLLA